MLRGRFGVTAMEFRHLDRLQASFASGHGVLLAPNHSRPSDPFVLARLGQRCRRPIQIMATRHIFVENALQAFLLPRLGNFSINREITDYQALRCAEDILVEARHPLVMFPEGIVSRTNDHLLEFQRGLSLVARRAAVRREPSGGRVVVHPIFLRYTHQGNTAACARPVLVEVEARLGWPPQDHLPLRQRILQAGEALLAQKEREYFECAAEGPLAPRIARLLEEVLGRVERRRLRHVRVSDAMARTRIARTAIVRRLQSVPSGAPEHGPLWQDIAHLYLVQQLHCYPPDYLNEAAPLDRLLEIVEHFEEDLTDKVRPHPPLHVTVWIGEPLPVEPVRRPRPDPLMPALRSRMEQLMEASRAAARSD